MAGNINLLSLDPDTIEANLKAYMKSQAVFKDYNFDGPNLSQLIRLLAYNTHLNAYYTNMAFGEMFLDSAQLRDSVISHAKELNYLPRSARSSTTNIDVTFNTSGIANNSFTILKGTQFSASVGSNSYVFTTDRAYGQTSSNGVFTFANLSLYEGPYISDTYIMDYQQETQRFLINNPTIDTDSLFIEVFENSGANSYQYEYAQSLLGLGPNSFAYFLQGAEDSKYEVVFGNGVFGRRPADGSVIQMTYRIASGPAADGANSFSVATDLIGQNGGTPVGNSVIVTSTTKSSGGANAESIDSIKFNAPRHYETQERAVNTSDYRILVMSNFTELKDVNVYGGETITGSVEYGRVYIAVSPISGNPLSDIRRTELQEFVMGKNPLGITPKVVDAEILYVNMNVTVYVDYSLTESAPTSIKASVSDGISTYNDSKLKAFNTWFSLTKLSPYINDADSGIVSSEIVMNMKKIISPPLNTPTSISLSFHNEISKDEPVYSTIFTSGSTNYRITDTVTGVTKDGTLWLVDATSGATSKKVGTVDYTTGNISITPISYSSFLVSPGIVFYAYPVHQIIKALQNDVIEIDMVTGLSIDVKKYKS